MSQPQEPAHAAPTSEPVVAPRPADSPALESAEQALAAAQAAADLPPADRADRLAAAHEALAALLNAEEAGSEPAPPEQA